MGQKSFVLALVAALILLVAPAAQAAYSGTNGKLVFSDAGVPNEFGDHNNDLFTATTSADRTNITKTPDDGEFGPQVSPDGRRVAYEVNGALFIRGIGDPTPVQVGGVDFASGPSWNPAGTQLAYNCTNDDFTHDVCVVDATAAGTNQHKVTTCRCVRFDGVTRWSPAAGGPILFVGGDAGDLETVPSGGGAVTNLTSGGADFGWSGPSWSPDGGRIAAVVDLGGVSPALRVMNANGASPHALASFSDGALGTAWSPDGTRLAVIAAPSGGGAGVVTVDPATGGSRQTVSTLTNDMGVELDWARVPPAGAPVATTRPATDVRQTTLSLNGLVNPNGAAATYHFEWGTTTAYGHSTPEAPAGNGTALAPVQAALSGLALDTTYHFRLVATNEGGTTHGADVTVRTLPSPEAYVSGSTLVYAPHAGETNTVSVSLANGAYTIEDGGSPIVPYGQGCTNLDANDAKCSAAGVTSVRIATGDLADSVDYSPTTAATIDTGTGNDAVAERGAAAYSVTLGTGNDAVQCWSCASPSNAVHGGDGADTFFDLATPAKAVTVYGDAGDDHIDGGDGGDQLHGGAGKDRLVGWAGNDQLVGDADADVLRGSAGADSLSGGDGNDSLNGDENENHSYRAYADVLAGGPGVDTVDYGERTSGLNISLDGAANDGTSGEGDNVGPAGDVENVTGGGATDVITGNGLPNFISGNGGADRISGAGGNDDLRASVYSSGVTIHGDAGNDNILGSNSGTDHLFGDDGNDTVTGGLNADGGSHDVLQGGLGDDRLSATAASGSALTGGAGDDTLLALNAHADNLIDCDGGGSGAGTNDSATADAGKDPAPVHCEHVTRG